MSVFMDFQIEPAISGKGAAILETLESFGGWWRWLFVGYVAEKSSDKRLLETHARK